MAQSTLHIARVVMLLCIVGSGHTCDNEWTSFQGSCYILGSDPVTWTDAEGMCRLVDANLVKIESREENDFVKRFLVNHRTEGQVWIGATDVFSEGEFVWVPQGDAVTFTDWGPTEPDHHTGPNSEDCTMMRDSNNWQWIDNACSTAARFVCEKKDTVIGQPVG